MGMFAQLVEIADYRKLPWRWRRIFLACGSAAGAPPFVNEEGEQNERKERNCELRHFHHFLVPIIQELKYDKVSSCYLLE